MSETLPLVTVLAGPAGPEGPAAHPAGEQPVEPGLLHGQVAASLKTAAAASALVDPLLAAALLYWRSAYLDHSRTQTWKKTTKKLHKQGLS